MSVIISTRPFKESESFAKELRAMGYTVVSYPSIATQKNVLRPASKAYLEDISSYDWILFTSQNGVRFFMDTLRLFNIDPAVLLTKKIGAVGPATAKEIEKYHLKVHFLPSVFTTAELARQIAEIKNKKILLPRSAIATPTLTSQLEEKGAKVDNMPIYKTVFSKTLGKKFITLIEKKKIRFLTFTSPSTIDGFMKNIFSEELQKKVLLLPVLSIGPVTTKRAQAVGFKKIITADIHTTEGMLKKLEESVL